MRLRPSTIRQLALALTATLLTAGLAATVTAGADLGADASPPPTGRAALPNLRARSADVVLDPSGLPVLHATFDNTGGAATGPFLARFTVDGAVGGRLHEALVPLPSLAPGDLVEWRFSWRDLPAYGTFTLAYALDAADAVAEGRESDNAARAVRTAPRPLDLPDAAYVRVDRGDGDFRPADAGEVDLRADGTLVLSPRARVKVFLPWLEHALGGPAGAAQPHAWVMEEDGAWLVTDGGADGAAFARADLHEGDLYTLGSLDTVRLAERPMLVRIASTPGWFPYASRIETPNGTVEQTQHRRETRLAIDFDGPDHSGQDVLFAKAWLASMGIKRPAFQHEDGTMLAADETETHFVVHATHFSTVYTFDLSDEGFTKEADRPLSEVAWAPLAGNVNVISDRTDPADEIFRRSLPDRLTNSSNFTVTSRWSTTLQGNWQGAYPIFLAREDVTDVNAHPSSIFVHYSSRDSNLGQNPAYYLRYRDLAGVLRLNHEFVAQPNTEYRFVITYNASVLTMKVRNFLDVDLASASYQVGSAPNDGFTLDKVGISSDGTGNTIEPRTEAWVDHITISAATGGTEPTCDIPGPDAGGYTCAGMAYAPEDVTNGTSVTLTDDSVTAPIPLPFTFNWYGVPRTNVSIGSNGLLCFNATGCFTYNPPAPPSTLAPNDLVACAWEDLDPSAGGTIRYATRGKAPNRVFVVEYRDVPHWSTVFVNTFQIQLRESGEAHCALTSLTDDGDSSLTASGTESPDGSTGVRYRYSALAATNKGIRFSPADVAGGFAEDFETGGTDWAFTGFWHVTTRRASSPTQSIWYGSESTGTYENGVRNDGTAVSPLMTIPSTTPVLTFHSWYRTEDTGTAWDVKIVEISTDGGLTWNRVGQVSGTPSAWRQHAFSLASWAGQNAKLRFRFDTVDDMLNQYEGWYVDNVTVASASANEPPTACFQHTVSGRNLTVDAGCSSDVNGDGLTYAWSWGDGGAASGIAAANTYSCPGGSYTVTLTVADGRGGESVTQKLIPAADPDADGDGLPSCRETPQSTSDAVADTDGDALNDLVESIWNPTRDAVFCAGAACAYPNPLRKDIYVEMDHMGADHLPSAADLQRIVDVFANAYPVTNPDGSTGVTLRLDAGSAYPGTAWDLGGGNAVPHDANLGTAGTSCQDYDWTEFQALKDAHFSTQRHDVFHYAVWAHALADTCGATSGVSRGIPGSDFIVSLGMWADHGNADARVGTFIHELGHNLGLRHGGGDDVNQKPNHLSVMNYYFQTRGVPKTDGTAYFGYSLFLLPTLNEAALDEQVGLNSALANDWKTKWSCPAVRTTSGSANGPIDWNCSGAINALVVTWDINGDRDCTTPVTCDTLTGHNDWAGLAFQGGLVGNGAATGAGGGMDVGPLLPMLTPVVQELTYQEDLALHG